MPLLLRLLLIYGAIVLLLIHQGTVVEYARKKGYEGVRPGLIGLIPLYGLYYYVRRKKRRNISKQGLRAVFSLRNFVSRTLIYGEIALISIIVIVPVVYIIGLSLSNIQSSVPSTIWPNNPNTGAFNYLFEETKFIRWYWNTLSIALINMIAGTVIITGAAYIFARFKFVGKRAGLLAILVLQAFPSFMGLIAMYVLFWTFGLLGQPRALSILYIGGSIPGNLWLVKGFLSQIPKDLDESAMIDGANKFQIFWRIILPLSVPILTFVAVTMFMVPWMDYILPGYLLNYYPPEAPPDYDVTQQWTLAVGLFKFIDDIEYIHYSAFAAGALLVGLPITILYMLFQRYLIEGIMAGATKG
ncbi:MAG: sugar ABC transporter permease [Acholeplasmataceae bacterium]